MEKKVGTITHYFAKISVAVIEMSGSELEAGDTIHIKGHTTDFFQKVSSMQIEHESVAKVEAGQVFALKVESPVRENDDVYLVTEEGD